MSVFMMLRANGDGKRMEEAATSDSGLMRTVVDRAKEYGLISHRFCGNEREIVIIDEWPNEEAFQGFFKSSPEIPTLMERAGVTAKPEITFWRKLETGDEVV